MATEGPQITDSFTPGGTILAYTFVKLSADKTVVACSGVTDKPIGVAQEPGASGGNAIPVCMVGVTKILGDANLAVGDSIGTSADAQAAAYTVADTTKYIVGQVLVENGAAGGYITGAINCLNSRVLA